MPKSSKKSKKSKKRKGKASIDKKRDVVKEKTYLTKEIETSITILDTPEAGVVTEALLFLSKYADLEEDNLVFLQQRGILPKLLKLLDQSIPTIRLSLRLISLLLTKQDAVLELDQNEYNDVLLQIADMFINNPDAPTREFCAAILARMAVSNRIVTLIFRRDLFTPIFLVLRESCNITLLMNVLEILFNLLDAPTASVLLATDKAFEPAILIARLNQFEKSMTSLILEIFCKLTYAGLNQMQKLCRESELMENLFRILLDHQKSQYNKIVFDIIMNCMENDETNSYFVRSREFLELSRWMQTCSGLYLLPCASILEKLTRNSSIMQMLFDLSVEDSVLFLLRSKDRNVLCIACSAISNMTSHRYCCDKMLTPVVFKAILKLMEYGTPVNASNEIGIECIYNFCKRNTRAIGYLESYGGIKIVIKYFYLGLTVVTVEVYKQILELLILLLATEDCQEKLLTPEFFSTILKQFQFDNEESCIICVELMALCINRKGFRDNFLNMGGPTMVINILKSTENKTLFRNLLIFVHNNLVYKSMSEKFVSANFVLLLKSFPPEITKEVPLIQRSLKLLYNLFLPLKFFETDMLEIADKLKNKFYIVTRPWEYAFPCLELLEAMCMSTRKTVYLIDYFLEQENSKQNSGISFDKVISKTSKKSVTSLNSQSSKNTNLCPYVTAPDPNLVEYILTMRNQLTDDMIIEDQVCLIAKFIDMQMCGPKAEYSEPEKLHSFKLHIESLKKKLETNTIPIGFIKIGFHCERALLFKAMADKLCVPCRLIRGSNTIYWNEIPLIRFGTFQGHLQYYVVDLMDQVGQLYAVGSRDANAYCDIK